MGIEKARFMCYNVNGNKFINIGKCVNGKRYG